MSNFISNVTTLLFFGTFYLCVFHVINIINTISSVRGLAAPHTNTPEQYKAAYACRGMSNADIVRNVRSGRLDASLASLELATRPIRRSH